LLSGKTSRTKSANDYERPTPELNHSIHRPDDGALSVRLRRSAPTFPPVWNVNTETLADGDRTNNLAETWNKAFAVLVGHSHPSVLVTVDTFQADLTLAEQMIDLDARGQPPVKRVKRNTLQLQRRLRSLCEDHRDGRKSVAETVRFEH